MPTIIENAERAAVVPLPAKERPAELGSIFWRLEKSAKRESWRTLEAFRRITVGMNLRQNDCLFFESSKFRARPLVSVPGRWLVTQQLLIFGIVGPPPA